MDTMTRIKAIETRYAGHRFRSRLEARWAVFFDTLGVSWQYEHEGYQTSAGWYLPDFRISPKHLDSDIGELFFEVKGSPLRQDEAERIAALVCDDPSLRFHVIPLGDIPDPRKACPGCIGLVEFGIYGWGGREPDRFCGDWRGTSVCVSMGRSGQFTGRDTANPFRGPIEASRMQVAFRSSAEKALTNNGCSCPGPQVRAGQPCERALSSPIGRALAAARSARFEHGETLRAS